MNERIFELAEQANEYATTRHPVSNIALSVNSEKFVKKFAELILQECLILFENAKVNQEDDVDYGLEEAKKHFGIDQDNV